MIVKVNWSGTGIPYTLIIIVNYEYQVCLLAIPDLLSISLYCTIYLGSWCHLSVKIKSLMCFLETFRAPTYIYMKVIYQISAQAEI